jgi:hypothetical protein
MNMQMAHTISPVRMFFFASRRFIVGVKNTSREGSYRWTSATIAQKSSAR